ncbi:MAG: hypothetical protein H7061_10575 [Bdellovibrionaceae bacterium]|nr:hypothetical protein [Bdellovibrio sp.]
MKTTTLFSFGVFSLLTTLSFLSNAQVISPRVISSKCDHVLTGSDNIQVNRQWDTATRNCFISLTPRNIENLKYRDYYFSNEGEFMVFNSYGNGPDSSMTGSRDFFIVPVVNEYPDFTIETNGDVTIKMVSGHQFRVSGKDFSIVSVTPGTFSEKPVSPSNQGGVEISLQTGFWIDGGFRKGGTRFGNPKSRSVIHSGKSAATCSVVNSQVLAYDSTGNYNFKLGDKDWTAFLAKQCPQIAQ